MDCGVVPLSSPMICNRSLAARASLCHRLQFFSHFVRYEIGFSKRFSNSAAASSRIGSFGSNGVINIATEDVEKSSGSSRSFSWDDVDSIATENVHDKVDRSDLQEYLHKVRICNQGSEMQSQFVPFMLEDQIVGFIHRGFISHLSKFKDVFSFVLGNDDSCAGAYVTLHPSLRTAEDRSRAVGNVIKYLGSLIPGVRNELYPVKPSFGMPILFSLERAAAPYFGIKAYAIHVNGYVEREGQKFLWVGKRSNVKPTYPGLLDQLVAGGMPHGITCQRNLMKECEEEAGIPYSISSGAIPVGATSYMDIEGHSYKRDVLFCYDLKLPEGFIPQNKDGEVESFRLIPIEHVANIVRKTEFFKPSCSLVMIDFLIRHGYIRPDACGYLELLQSLRSGDCS